MESNNIKVNRARLNITQEDLAYELGVDVGTIIRAEKGENISLYLAIKIATTFEKTLTEIFNF